MARSKQPPKTLLRGIRMIILDVDGVLAKPQIIWSGQDSGKGLYEIKAFCVHDGSATWAAQEAGLIQIVISGRDSLALRKRMERLRIDALFAGKLNKIKVLEKLKTKYRLQNKQIAYLGDDFLDLPILEAVGLPMAVQDATPEVKRVARYVTKKKGGEGAVAEALRLILSAQGTWMTGVRKAIRSAYQ